MCPFYFKICRKRRRVKIKTWLYGKYSLNKKNVTFYSFFNIDFKVQYNVDPTVLKFGEKGLFLKYLAYETVFIDVWDGDSLHLIGTSTVELKQLLRQGNEAVQAAYELDVLNTEYEDDSIANSSYTVIKLQQR